MPDDEQSITNTSPAWEVRLPQWAMVRDALEGEERIKERGTGYLPKPTGMKARDYQNLVARASFYGVADRTLRGLVGLVFRVDPVIVLPPRMESMIEAASPEGFTMSQLVRETLREVLSLGRYGMLVDMPQVQGAVPYIATWKAEDIFRWEERIDLGTGRRRLTRVVVMEEPVLTQDRTITFLRELFIDPETNVYKQQRWVEVEPEVQRRTRRSSFDTTTGAEFLSGSFVRIGDEITPSRFGQPLTEIPFIFVNVFDHRARPERPPTCDLVNMNMAHYRNSADYETALHMIGSPTPYVFGIRDEDAPTTVGPTQIWHGTAKDVKVGMLEYTGQGVATIRLAMKDKEDRMSVLGARLIRGEDRENVTAETTRLEAREETSVLLGAIKSVEEAYHRALTIAATWVGASPEGVSVTLNRDFVETRLTAEELTALVKAWQLGGVSDETYHHNLQRGEIVESDRTMEDERSAADTQLAARTKSAAERTAEANEIMAVPDEGSDETTGPKTSGEVTKVGDSSE